MTWNNFRVLLSFGTTLTVIAKFIDSTGLLDLKYKLTLNKDE